MNFVHQDLDCSHRGQSHGLQPQRRYHTRSCQGFLLQEYQRKQSTHGVLTAQHLTMRLAKLSYLQ